MILSFTEVGGTSDAGGTSKVFHLVKNNEELNFYAFILGKNDEEYNFCIEVICSAPNTKANVTICSVLHDNAKVNFKGRIVVRKNAKNSDSYLSHRTLLLSDNAKSTTLPAMEIETGDVKAGHSATVGRVDDQMLFYLMSRGIERKKAISLLVESFFVSAMNKISDQKLKKKIIDLILGRHVEQKK